MKISWIFRGMKNQLMKLPRGYIFYKNQRNEMALHCFSKQRILCEANYTFFHDLTARSYNDKKIASLTRSCECLTCINFTQCTVITSNQQSQHENKSNLWKNETLSLEFDGRRRVTQSLRSLIEAFSFFIIFDLQDWLVGLNLPKCEDQESKGLEYWKLWRRGNRSWTFCLTERWYCHLRCDQ